MRGFIFDCDGVLLDSIGAWHSLDAQLAADAGIVLTEQDRNTLNASTLGEAAQFFHEHYGVGNSVQEVHGRFMDYLLQYYRNEASEVPGALAFVKALKAAGAPMCVLSSSPLAFLQAGLARVGFTDYIDTVLSVDELPFKKRDPQLYPHVCSLLGIGVENAWMFDDSKYALATADEAGVSCVGVFSANECGTHEQLGLHAKLVVDSFVGLTVDQFL